MSTDLDFRDCRPPQGDAVAGPRLRFDFPSEAVGGGALEFANPFEIAVARVPSDVRDVLARAEALAREGSWVAGFVCYEAGAAFDRAFRFRGESSLPLAWFAAFNSPVEPSLVNEGPPGSGGFGAWGASIERSGYDEQIDRILASIRAGDLYQVNHTIRLASRFDGDGRAIYHRVRARQPDGYCACLDLGRHKILSLSPELFFRRDGSLLTSKPMKGTLARQGSPVEDEVRARQLRECPKNRAENLMIVDLLRNDLSRVAAPHTVRVPELFAVEIHPTVLQMTSTVTAALRPEAGLPEIFAALFPCGSITGAPKVKAMELIAKLESAPRGIYCGAIGLLKPGGDAIFNVAIRTLLLDTLTGQAEYGVGGGITIESAAKDEYEEILTKSRILQATM